MVPEEKKITEVRLKLEAVHLNNIFGSCDEYIKIIEKNLGIKAVAREDELILTGEKDDVTVASRVINDLYLLSKRGNTISAQNVNYALALEREGGKHSVSEIEDYIICHTVNGKPIKAKTLGQKSYVDAIEKKMITFGIGPAGTGKTYLAMAEAIRAFKNEEIERIILTRPAIEAGEKLGFLPGDLQSKVDPYLRPLYDALYQIMGAETFMRNTEKGWFVSRACHLL